MPRLIKSITEIKVGDFYEDCAFHPCLCTVAGSPDDKDGVEGISLVNGTHPRCCSATHCGLRILTVEEAIHWKLHGPKDEPLENFSEKERWWK